MHNKQTHTTLVIIIFMAIMTISAPALAVGPSIYPWDTRGLPNLGESPSAIAYNAAGITNLPGIQTQAGVTLTRSNFTVGIEGYEDTTTSTNILSPHAYVTGQINDNLWLGLGLYDRFSKEVDFGSEWVGTLHTAGGGPTVGDSVEKLSVVSRSILPTVAYKVPTGSLNSVFSVAVAPEIMHMIYDIDTALYINAANEFNNNIKSEGFGFGYNLSANYRLELPGQYFDNYWTFGLTYRSEIEMDMDGHRKSVGTGAFGAASNNVDLDCDVKYILPQEISGYVEFKPYGFWHAYLGTTWTQWSAHRSIQYTYETGEVRKLTQRFNDTWRIELGSEFKFDDGPDVQHSWRINGVYMSSMTKPDYSRIVIPLGDTYEAKLGYGLKYKNFELDLAGSYSWGEGGSTDNSAVMPIQSGTKVTFKNVHSYSGSIMLGWNF